MKPKSILLVDNNERFLHSAVRFLATDPCLAVVGWAFTAKDAFKKISLYQPDLVLLNINLPDNSGFEMINVIKKMPSVPKIILTSFYDDAQYFESAKTYGADGFISKTDFGSQIGNIINNLFEEI